MGAPKIKEKSIQIIKNYNNYLKYKFSSTILDNNSFTWLCGFRAVKYCKQYREVVITGNLKYLKK